MLGILGGVAALGGLGWVFDVFESDPPPEPAVRTHVELGPPTVSTLPGGATLRFAADQADYIGPDGMGYIVPGPIGEVGRPPTDRPAGWRTWAYAQGGVDSPATTVRVTLQGNPDRSVAIVDVRPEIERREPVRNGIRVKGAPAGCGGEQELYLSLDEGKLEPATPRDAPPYEIGPGELEFLSIVAIARQGTYRWRLKAVAVSGGKRKTITVDNGGKPFVTSALGDAKEWAWRADNPVAPNPRFKWVPSGQPC